MLNLLTQYLIKHREVSIPSLGSFVIVPIPARFAVADQEMLAPAHIVTFREELPVSARQATFFAQHLNTDTAHVTKMLEDFGRNFRNLLREQTVYWNGFGTLSIIGEQVRLHQDTPPLFEPVAAHKRVRRDAQHAVRRGETEVVANFHDEVASPVLRSYSRNSIAWIIALVALAAVVFILVKYGTHNGNSGLQWAM